MSHEFACAKLYPSLRLQSAYVQHLPVSCCEK